MKEAECRRLKISGRVQGVCYRASAIDEARRIGVDGWVRNCRDGSVEALVAGASEKVEAFIEWCRVGPPAAQVARVEIFAADFPETPGFSMQADA